jgi:hypothetical protein
MISTYFSARGVEVAGSHSIYVSQPAAVAETHREGRAGAVRAAVQ